MRAVCKPTFTMQLSTLTNMVKRLPCNPEVGSLRLYLGSVFKPKKTFHFYFIFNFFVFLYHFLGTN